MFTFQKQMIHQDHRDLDLVEAIPLKLGETQLLVRLALVFQIMEVLMLKVHA